MTQPAKAQEPTMEEILASIRRIIADDDTSKAPPKSADPVPPPPTPVAQRPEPVVPPRPVPPPSRQAEIESMLTTLNAVPPPPTPVPPPPPRPAPQEEPPDVLELTESMAEPEPAAFRTIDGQSDVIFQERPPEPETAEPRRRELQRPDTEVLISSSTSAAVDSAFNSLAQTVLVHNARTLEDLVREMLRPLLKTWLDDNLPELVERLVRAEIERVSRGRN
jgi:cell pole-organizing protein PopZ